MKRLITLAVTAALAASGTAQAQTYNDLTNFRTNQVAQETVRAINAQTEAILQGNRIAARNSDTSNVVMSYNVPNYYSTASTSPAPDFTPERVSSEGWVYRFPDAPDPGPELSSYSELSAWLRYRISPMCYEAIVEGIKAFSPIENGSCSDSELAHSERFFLRRQHLGLDSWDDHIWQMCVTGLFTNCNILGEQQ